MRTKFLLTNILLALALPLAPTGARADSATGATNIIIGSTPVSERPDCCSATARMCNPCREPIRWAPAISEILSLSAMALI